MSDQRIRNISELEKALEASHLRPSHTGESSPHPQDNSPLSQPETPTLQWPTLNSHDTTSRVNSPAPSSKDRTGTYQSSSNQLLVNLGGLQTTTNAKLDVLTDAVLRLGKSFEALADEQRKQTEVLMRIMQNTAEPKATPQTTSQVTKSVKTSSGKCKDYGFTNSMNVISEFILQILRQAEIQIKSQGKGYRSSRTMERVLLDKAITVLCETEYKVGGTTKPKLDIPKTASESCVYLASKIGSTDRVKPIITPQYMIQLFNDPSCRTMISVVSEVLSRLKFIRWMIPYYEADIVNALEYPYFDDDGKVICNWGSINPRSETETEAKILTSKVEKRIMLGKLVIRGVEFDKALATAMR